MEVTRTRHPRRWLILVVLCLSTLVLVIDNMVLTVAVPPLAADVGASAQDIQWILDSYILVFAGLLLSAGSLSDRFGRRKIMIIGLVLFGAASLTATFAGEPGQLITARAMMGVGGALIMPSTLSILINVPIAILAIIAALVLMPESKGPWSKPDPLGAILSAVGMTALVWTIIELPKNGLTHSSTLATLALATAALIAFVVWELRTPHPMVPLGLFRNRTFSGGSFSLALVQIGNGGLLLVLTQYLQYVLGYTPTQAGLAFIPMAIASLTFNTLGATLGTRIGNRTLIVAGLTVSAAGFGLLATHVPGTGFMATAVALFVLGAGGGLAMPAAISALMGTVPPEHAGVGSALNDTLQQMGAALGVAFLGSVVSGTFTGAMPASAGEQARLSIGDALAVAARTADTTLAEAARGAFTTAMSSAFALSACGVLAAAVLALLVIRSRTPDPALADPASAGVTSADAAQQQAVAAMNH